jgi:hypothetical protein
MPGARLPPRPPALPSQTFTFNDGTATPMPNGIPSNFIWSNAENAATPPQRVNIQRLTPINQSTAATNAVWQGALKAQNSVWQFYQLTMTRWPNPPIRREIPDHRASLFLAGAATSAFANTILETWDQTNIRTGCMNCHTIVQNNDFLWSQQMNAFTPTQVSFGLRPASPAVSELRALLNEQFK